MTEHAIELPASAETVYNSLTIHWRHKDTADVYSLDKAIRHDRLSNTLRVHEWLVFTAGGIRFFIWLPDVFCLSAVYLADD